MKRFVPLIALAALLLSACGNNMHDQPSLRPYQPSPFFADGMGMRPAVEGTVARSTGNVDPVYFTGMGPMGPVSELPIELTLGLLQRGQERYDIYCAVCHGYTGHGDGMVVSRGFPAPASFHEPRLLASPVGYSFVAMTNGFGRMFSYASRIPTEDRWAIAAYIKALQLSQNASLEDVPVEVRLELLNTEGQVR